MKKKIVSMILTLSLVISGLPVTAANAAELAENELLQEETTNVYEMSDAAETDNSTDEQTENIEIIDGVNQTVKFTKKNSDAVMAADYSRFHVNSDGKAVGSDGVTYDDVVYLSVDTVAALDTEVQDNYIMLCDVAAKWATEGIEDIVIAVDEDGSLNWSCYIPGVMLAETQKELIEGVLSSETEESTEVAEASEDKYVESEETVSAEETETEEKENVTVESAYDEESETESDVEESTEDKSEETTTEESTVEEKTEAATEDGLEESASTEEESTEEDSTEESTEADSTEESTEADLTEEESTEEDSTEEESTEDFVVELKAENMELIPVFENEQIEFADELDVNVIDLGYGMNKTFNATLPSDSYFSKQLTANESKVYTVARKRLTAGNTTFEIPANVFNATDSGLDAMIDAVMRSVSAVILTDTEKVEWFANPGGLRIKEKADGTIGTYNPTTNKITKCTIEVEKSKYYSKELDTAANAKVSKVVAAAQDYAIKNYPASPAYGIVEYFDKWICENNYYNIPGGVSRELGPEVYYYCHSSYGALLNGYAVCESYAKAISRLLDAVGIPNMYVSGYAFNDPVNGGHAWNYVQMPDTSWYLLDSTWNNPSYSAADASETSTKEFLLAAGDRDHTATGSEYIGQSNGFEFPALSNSKYIPTPEPEVAFKEGTVMPLAVKGKGTLTLANDSASYAITSQGVWTSSNVKVAKVDQKGNVTAVAPGTAIISYSTYVAGIEKSAECAITVYQVKAITSANTGKASDSVSLETEKKIPRNVKLNINVGDTPYTAKYMAEQNEFNVKEPEISYTKSGIVTASIKWDEVDGDCFDVEITPQAKGTTKINVSFGGKKVTITATVSEKLIDETMFTIDWAKAKVENGVISYTGKAVKPVVKKSESAPKDLKFKTTYISNTNAGTATVKVSGSGNYGGEIYETFEIKKKDISGAVVTGIKNQLYNGGSNPVPAVVKVDKKKLVANKDYRIIYNDELSSVTEVGTYKLSIQGIGNYEGNVNQSLQDYQITKNTIDKMSITCAKVSYTGGAQNPVTVKIGKNIVPSSEYTVKFYDAKDTKRTNEISPILKGSYTAVVTVNSDSNNLTTGQKKELVKKFTIK